MVPIIIDIVVVLLAVLFLVVGIKRALIKTLQGFLSSIIVIVLVVVSLVPVTNLVINGTELDNKLALELEVSFAEKIPNSYATIRYYDLNEDGTDELIYEAGNEKHDYENIFEGSTLKFLGVAKLLQPRIEEQLNAENGPDEVLLISVLTETMTKYIFLAIMTVIMLIVYKLVLWLLFKLLDKLSSNLYIMHFLNKTLGGIVGFLLGATVVLIIVTIIQLLAPMEFMAPVNTYLEQTTVTSFLMDNNFLLKFVQTNVDISKITAIIPKREG
jgi:uncharacterized membrane protein required for colicin V production